MDIQNKNNKKMMKIKMNLKIIDKVQIKCKISMN